MRGLGTCIADEGTNGVRVHAVDGGYIVNWTEAHLAPKKNEMLSETESVLDEHLSEARIALGASIFPNFENKTAVRVTLHETLALLTEILTSSLVHRE